MFVLFYKFVKNLYEFCFECSYSSFKETWDEWKNGDELARSMTLSFKKLVDQSIIDAEALIKLLQKRKKSIQPSSQEFIEIDKQISDVNQKLSQLCKAKEKVNDYCLQVEKKIAQK